MQQDLNGAVTGDNGALATPPRGAEGYEKPIYSPDRREVIREHVPRRKPPPVVTRVFTRSGSRESFAAAPLSRPLSPLSQASRVITTPLQHKRRPPAVPRSPEGSMVWSPPTADDKVGLGTRAPAVGDTGAPFAYEPQPYAYVLDGGTMTAAVDAPASGPRRTLAALGLL
jgi:hypothetical protein